MFGNVVLVDESRMTVDPDGRLTTTSRYAVRILSHEGREKLAHTRPRSLGQAARIPGVTPADISILMVWLESSRRRSAVSDQPIGCLPSDPSVAES